MLRIAHEHFRRTMPPSLLYFRSDILEVVVNTISIVSMRSVAETEAGDALTAIALFCLLGLVASLCMAAFGLDVSAGSL
jgi:hypothetical protein